MVKNSKNSDQHPIISSNNTSVAAKSQTKNNGKGVPEVSDAAIKKPTAKQLVGGISWTGKLPTALLHEFCQKQGWLKPDQALSRRSNNYIVTSATLARKNKKNSESETVTLRPTKEELSVLPEKDSAVEARNIGATWCLHRIGHKLNFSMQMPQDHRQIWAKLEAIRKDDIKNGKEFLYDVDPFKAAQSHLVALKKWETEKAKKVLEQAKSAGTVSFAQQNVAPWQNVPQIDMSKEMRQRIEMTIRSLQVQDSQPAAVCEHSEIIRELVSLGFREIHAQEACKHASTVPAALEFLLLFTPEDDLPHQFLPPSYSTGLSGSSHDTESLQLDYAAKRLHHAGYALDLCRQLINAVKNEDLASEILQAGLLQQMVGPAPAVSIPQAEWTQEIESLEAIYSDSFRSSITSSEVSLALPNHSDYRLHLRPPVTLIYPQRPPSFYVSSTAPLPSYIRLAIIRQAGQYAQTLLGGSVVFLLLEFIDENIENIMRDPGNLLELAGTVVGHKMLSTEKSLRRKDHSKPRRRRMINWQAESAESGVIRQKRDEIARSVFQRSKYEARQRLPAFAQRQKIVDILKKDQFLVISGETGSGKSTQVVQYVLDDMIDRGLGEQCNIICTQPRRISALGLADRVGHERSNFDEVGYAIRGDSKQSPRTKISFVTTGVLLRRLTVNGDAGLDGVTHVFVDEVHERSINSDFLLIALRDLAKNRKDLKIVLMSATVEANLFCSYLGGAKHLHIEGRTFPVQDYYLDDMDFLQGEKTKNGVNYALIGDIVEHIDSRLGPANPGGILVFLPGTMDISRTIDELGRRSNGKWNILPLHASLPAVQQKKVFQRSPDRRKIIAATNVAETSITIDDILAVIDTGRVKQMRYDASSRITKFEEVWCSKAACKQRRGRAGRVQAGFCYKTFTRLLEANKMAENTEPEIVRTPLEQVLLSALAMSPESVPRGIHSKGQAFLKKAVTVPNQQSLDNAISLLLEVGAIDNQENLTSLGRMMALLPADVKVAKLLILSSIFGIPEHGIIVAACLSTKSPFLSGPESGESKRRFAGSNGDVFGTVNAYNAWNNLGATKARRDWCETNILSEMTMQEIESTALQYFDSMKDARLISLTPTFGGDDGLSDSIELLKSLISASLSPNIARIQLPPRTYAATSSGALERDPEARQIKFYTQSGRVFLHPSSAVFAQNEFRPTELLSFFEVTETTKLFIRGVTPVGIYGHLLLSGAFAMDSHGRGLMVHGWIKFGAWPKIAVFIKLMRQYIAEIMDHKIDDPEWQGDNQVISVMKHLIEKHGQ